MKHSVKILPENALFECEGGLIIYHPITIGGTSRSVVQIGQNLATATGTGAHAYAGGTPSGFVFVNGVLVFP